MNCKSLLFAATFAATLAFAPMVPAQTAPSPAQAAQQTVQRYVMQLGLTSTQQEEALTIYTAEQTTEAPIRTSEHLAHSMLATAIEASDTSTITQVSVMLGQLNGQITQAHSLADAQFYAILTSEQKAKFAQMLASGGGANSSFGGPGGPPRR